MKRSLFLLALLVPFSAQAKRSASMSPASLEVVGPTVLMNAARFSPIVIFDLRPHGRAVQGRAVPGATRDLNAPVGDKPVFALGDFETVRQWATKRALRSVQIVPAQLIEFANMAGVPQMEPAAAHCRSESGWPLFDISEEFEFQSERLPRSQRFDFMDFRSRKWEKLPRDKPFIVACRVGHRSQLVVQELRAAGYDARNLRGGFWEWQCQNLPLEGKRP